MTELTVLTSADRNIKDIVFTDQHLIKLYYTSHIDNPRELQNLGSMIFFDKFQSDQAVSAKYQNILSNKHLAKLISQSSEFISFPIQFFEDKRKSLSHIACDCDSKGVIGLSFVSKSEPQFGNEDISQVKKILDKELERFEIYINNEAYEWRVWSVEENRTEKGKFIYVPKEQLQSGKNYTLDEAINDAKSYINSLVKTPEFSL